MKKKPETSIIMNCHNGEKFLNEAIKSILNQSYRNWELIFWDNKSTDKSKKIFKSFKDKRLKYYYTHKKVSLYESRNAALKKASGKFISFLDVDDYWFKDKLKKQIIKFKDQNVGLVYGKYWKINPNNLIRKKQLIARENLPTGNITKELLKNYYVGLLTIVIRKKFIMKHKEVFKVKYNYLGDLDFVLRFSTKYKFDAVQEPIGVYRQHENQMQRENFETKSKQFSLWFKDIKKSKLFGEEKNLILFEEWNRFQSVLTLIKLKKYIKSIKEIIYYPNNLNKIKLIILLIFPEFVSKNVINET